MLAVLAYHSQLGMALDKDVRLAFFGHKYLLKLSLFCIKCLKTSYCATEDQRVYIVSAFICANGF